MVRNRTYPACRLRPLLDICKQRAGWLCLLQCTVLCYNPWNMLHVMTL